MSLVLVISLAIIHKAYWVSTTETNPDEIWGNKQITKNGNNWTIDFEEEVGDSITFKGILRTAPKFEVYRNDTFVPGKYSEGEALVYSEDLYVFYLIALTDNTPKKLFCFLEIKNIHCTNTD